MDREKKLFELLKALFLECDVRTIWCDGESPGDIPVAQNTVMEDKVRQKAIRLYIASFLSTGLGLYVEELGGLITF